MLGLKNQLPLAPKGRARHLCLAELEPVISVNRDEVNFPGDRVANRLDLRAQKFAAISYVTYGPHGIIAAESLPRRSA